MSSYFSINKNYKEELVVKDSKFISFLFPITSKSEFENILNQLWKEHPKARHICYAYILDENNFHYYDDGEPSGTAGMRIYSALKFKNLSRCALFVVRYFGGTKLGAGPLARAYFDASMKVINSAEIVEKFVTKTVRIKVKYELFEKLKRALKNLSSYEPEIQFSEVVEMKVFIDSEKIADLIDLLQQYNLEFIIED